jgi:DNA-binding NarL/FixJ family response regulator
MTDECDGCAATGAAAPCGRRFGTACTEAPWSGWQRSDESPDRARQLRTESAMGKKLRRIVLIDCRPLFEAGLRALLAQEADIEIFSESRERIDARPAEAEVAAHVVLIDKTAAAWEDPQQVEAIKRRYSNARVLWILGRNNAIAVHAPAHAGSDSHIRRDATQEEFRLAIRSVLRVGRYPEMDVAETASGARPGGKQAGALAGLTPRELVVLKLVAAGNSSEKIGGILGISAKTVSKHRTRLMAKLGVRNAAGLTAYALERGLVL